MGCVCNGIVRGHEEDLLAPHSATQSEVHVPAALPKPEACSILQNLMLKPNTS